MRLLFDCSLFCFYKEVTLSAVSRDASYSSFSQSDKADAITLSMS